MTKLEPSFMIAFKGIVTPNGTGLGVMIFSEQDNNIWRLRKNVQNEGSFQVQGKNAEYKALIFGLEYAIKNEFKNVSVFGESNSVVNDIARPWETHSTGMWEMEREMELCLQVLKMKKFFNTFSLAK
ncbi:hypothetical protein L195_g048867, partial [Trifolium pratense]